MPKGMRSVLISIQPKWCELIASGKKTVEVRKTKPKIEMPFKVYIYATKPRHYFKISEHLVATDENLFLSNGTVKMSDGFEYWADGIEVEYLNGKVIGEFVCDMIRDYSEDAVYHTLGTCLTATEIADYIQGKYAYFWHISNLVIYDKPKELSEFISWKKCNSCRESGYESTACCYDDDCKVPSVITKAPQSWCYAENEVQNNENNF